MLCTHAPSLSPPFSVDFNGNWPPQSAALYFALFIPTLPWHVPECSCCMNIKKHLLCLKGYLSHSSGATCEGAVVNLDPCLVFATGRSTSQPTQPPRRSWMGCWSQTLPRCTWCRLGWQVMTAPSPPPCCLFVTVCRWVLYLSVCLSVSLPEQC